MTDDDKEKILVSAGSKYKPEDIDLLGEEEVVQKTVKTASDNQFPELDELAKEVFNQEYEENSEEDTSVRSSSSEWALPMELRNQVCGKARLKVFTGHNTVFSLHGYLSTITVGSDSGRFRLLMTNAEFARFFDPFTFSGMAKTLTKKEATSLMSYIIGAKISKLTPVPKHSSKNPFGFAAASTKKASRAKLIRGIKEKKTFESLTEIGTRLLELKIQFAPGHSSVLKSPWDRTSKGQNAPEWKFNNLTSEASGVPDFIWVDVMYSS